jgi:threonine dehydrogenase-like Zn-dependent dehydrogenase
MTTDEVYYERGINLLHGFLTERYVDNSEYIVKVPNALAESGVLLEPVSIVEKGVEQAYEIQRRLEVWRPERAAVVGAGPLELLATLVLRLRGLGVTVLALTEPPTSGSELVEALGARYVSTRALPLVEASESYATVRSTSSSRRRGRAAWSSRVWRLWARTAFWCSPASVAGIRRSRFPETVS